MGVIYLSGSGPRQILSLFSKDIYSIEGGMTKIRGSIMAKENTYCHDEYKMGPRGCGWAGGGCGDELGTDGPLGAGRGAGGGVTVETSGGRVGGKTGGGAFFFATPHRAKKQQHNTTPNRLCAVLGCAVQAWVELCHFRVLCLPKTYGAPA